MAFPVPFPLPTTEQSSTITNYSVRLISEIVNPYDKKTKIEYEVYKLSATGVKRKFLRKWKKTINADYCMVIGIHEEYSANDQTFTRNEFSYSYDFIQDPPNSRAEYDPWPYIRLSKSTIYRGNSKIENSFEQYDADNNLLKQKLVYTDDNLIQSDVFGYTLYTEWWFLTSRECVYNGHQYRESYQYDDWGNLTYKSSTGGDFTSSHDDVEEWFTYKNTDSEDDSPAVGAHDRPYLPADSPVPPDIHNRPLTHYVLYHTPVSSVSNGQPISGTSLQEAVFKYDDTGRLINNAVWDGSAWLLSTLSYDAGQTKPKQVTVDRGSVTIENTVYAYDNHGNPIQKTQYLKGSEGSFDLDNPVIRRWSYDADWGWKIWEKDPEGYVTVYRYAKPDGTLDYKGRVWEIELPNDDDNKNWIPNQGETPSPRAGNPTIHIAYDDELLTRTITDQLGNKTLYQYDRFGTLISIKKYMQPTPGSYQEYSTTTVAYDSQGHIAAITDPRGNKTPGNASLWQYRTEFKYNDLGLLTDIVYPGMEETNRPTKQIDYDFSTGIFTAHNERNYATYETRDAANRVIRIEVEKADWQDRSAVTTTEYDGAGNKVRTVVQVYDANGNIVNLETLYTYDQLGRLTGVYMPGDTYLEGGSTVTARPIITYEYEYTAVGLKKREIRTLAGGTTHVIEIIYDQLGRVIGTHTTYKTKNASGQEQTASADTKIVYDKNGNKTSYIDANNHEYTAHSTIAWVDGKSCKPPQ